MGVFLTNVQVFTGGGTLSQVRSGIIDTIQTWMTSRGYVQVNEKEQATRRIMVAPETSSSWIAVYDEATEIQDTDLLEELSGILSTTAGKTAISVLVHDSDLLELTVFRNGRKTGQVTNWPEYYEGAAPSAGPVGTGKGLEEFGDFLSSGRTVLNLQEAWQQAGAFERAIGILKRTSTLVGWDDKLSLLGFNSLPATVATRSTKLLFRFDAPPASSHKEPIFGHSGGEGPDHVVYAGDPVSLTMIAHSTARTSTGLTITLWGSALEQGLVDPESATIFTGPPGGKPVAKMVLNEAVSTSGKLRTGTLPDFRIPQGISDPATAFKDSAGQFEKGFQAWMATRIEIQIQTQALAAGTGSIHIGIVPVENTDNGSTSWTFSFTIKPPLH